MSMIQTSERLTKPRNQMAHLLYDMIRGKMITEQQYNYNQFRGSISDLRLVFGAPIRHRDVPFTNTFGRKSTYRKHYILSIDVKKAIRIFNRINK